MRRRARSRRNRGKGGLILGILLLLGIGGAIFYIHNSPQFERIPPKIAIKPKVVVGTSGSLAFDVTDNYGLKRVEVFLSNGKERSSLLDARFQKGVKSKKFNLVIPQNVLSSKNSSWKYEIRATDNSLWNFFAGNHTKVSGELFIDSTPPSVTIEAKSLTFMQGGAALVIYKVDEQNLDQTYIDIGQNRHFYPSLYRAKGVYATLIAWPFNKEQIHPQIVAVDKAGNKVVMPITFLNKLKEYRVSYIQARDSFIDGKISQLAANDSDYAKISDRLEKLRAINELMRQKNEKLIHKFSTKVTPIGNSWDIKKMYPLHGAKRVSGFGVKRYYYYKSRNNIVSTSYHVGYDFASLKNDKIYSPMDGSVVYAAPNGIYGNMILIDHGLGLYTLYGHISQMNVKAGDKVAANEVIGLTGKTGLALGDHLHFGVLVQGVEVIPLEWMSKKWINDQILLVFQKANEKLGYNKSR